MDEYQDFLDGFVDYIEEWGIFDNISPITKQTKHLNFIGITFVFEGMEFEYLISPTTRGNTRLYINRFVTDNKMFHNVDHIYSYIDVMYNHMEEFDDYVEKNLWGN